MSFAESPLSVADGIREAVSQPCRTISDRTQGGCRLACSCRTCRFAFPRRFRVYDTAIVVSPVAT
jgi:hypothetical protein